LGSGGHHKAAGADESVQVPRIRGGLSEDELVERLYQLLEPVVRSEGLVLVEITFRREGHGRVLRLIVDLPQGGVTLDECARLSRQVSDLLDVEDLIQEPHHLEVSSPGLNRRLKTRRDFEIFAGRQARIVVRDQEGGTTTWQGRLLGIKADEVLLETGGMVRALPLDQVAKASLKVDF